MAEQRIQKVLADQGICSRREAERLMMGYDFSNTGSALPSGGSAEGGAAD